MLLYNCSSSRTPNKTYEQLLLSDSMLKDTKITEDTNCTEKNSAGWLVCIIVSLTMVCIENPHFLITGDYDTMLAALYIIHNCSQELARLRNPQMLLHLSNSPHLTRAFEQTFAVNSKYLVVQISRCQMFPADRGRRWHLFLTNSPVTLCVCKTISSVPTSVNFSELSSKHSQ